ncbi:hypothetical protein DZC30_18570 [Comamonas testosteroni]|uniref:Bacteriophage T5 Orf172 DNA-binding domain-containing protein n=1 Tax=Comamonas testosteroni TaxID=285 RepID=A0A373FAZ4_COMTE|nr:GIY-YIG nuclease family protein [Comamonas testosteroni]RGE41314.1 hypothetical protein DZC30_18570 [Comamonas testosteroni]
MNIKQPSAFGGWVYVLETGSDYNRFKVGRTKNSPMRRVKSLRTADPLLALRVGFYIPPTLPGKLSVWERCVHRFYESCRIEFIDESGEESEWFRGNPGQAVLDIECLFEEVTDFFEPGSTKVWRAYEPDVVSFYAPPSTLYGGIPWGA